MYRRIDIEFDENDEKNGVLKKKERKKRMLRSLLVHRTNKVVDVYHIGLGLTYYTLMLSLLFYVVYVQIYLGGGYQVKRIRIFYA